MSRSSVNGVPFHCVSSGGSIIPLIASRVSHRLQPRQAKRNTRGPPVNGDTRETYQTDDGPHKLHIMVCLFTAEFSPTSYVNLYTKRLSGAGL